MIVVAAALAGCTAGTRSVTTGSSAGTTPPTVVGTAAPASIGTSSVGSVPLAPPVTTAPRTVVTHPASGTTLAPVPRTTTVTRPPSAGPVSISLSSADFGKTVQLRVRDSVQVTLDDAGMRWGSLTVSPAGPLRPQPAPPPPPNGQLAVWTAVQPGTVTVTATGTAGCTPPRACPLFARLFQLTIVIS